MFTLHPRERMAFFQLESYVDINNSKQGNLRFNQGIKREK